MIDFRLAHGMIPTRIIRADQDDEALSRGCRHRSRRGHAPGHIFFSRLALGKARRGRKAARALARFDLSN